jgi:hypothetical protein
MKRNAQVTTKVLDVGEDRMKIRTDVIVTRENGLRSSHMEVRSVRHFGDWQLESKAVHDPLLAVFLSSDLLPIRRRLCAD